MKKKLMSFVMALMAVTCVSVLSSCDGVMDNAVLHIWKVSITGDGVKNGKATMKIETTLQLGLDIVPSNVNVVDPVWSSSDESVATVDANGLVTAVAVGVTTIDVYSAYNPDIKNSIELTVAEVPVEAVNITAPATPFEMTLGDEDVTLTATVTPADATDKKVTWSSSAPTVATVDETGKIHAVAAGTTTIKATTANGKEASIELTVNAPMATVTTAPTAKTGVKAGENAEIINAGVTSDGEMQYKVTTTNTKPTSTEGFSATVPTAQSLAAGTCYVWYYVKADATHADSDIAGSVSVTIAEAIISTKDASETFTPTAGTVTGTYFRVSGIKTLYGWQIGTGNHQTITISSPDGLNLSQVVLTVGTHPGYHQRDASHLEVNHGTLTVTGTTQGNTVTISNINSPSVTLSAPGSDNNASRWTFTQAVVDGKGDASK